jgi:HD superfamily phosphohydrolase YqeK
MIDPTQPSPKALAAVNNKNNLADVRLRYTLAQVEREKVAKMNDLHHERLEVLGLLHDIQRRDTDKDPVYLK